MGFSFGQIAPRPQSGNGGTWRGVVCGAAARETDTPGRHPQSRLTDIKTLYWDSNVKHNVPENDDIDESAWDFFLIYIYYSTV